MNVRVVTPPSYSPSPPWIDGQTVTRNTDGVLFTYSASLNALTIVPNASGAIKNARNFIIQNLPSPINSGDAANKAYVDASTVTGGIPEAPTDGGTYVRQNSAWINTIDGGASYTLLRSGSEKQDYVEVRAGIPEAPTDGGTYARQNAAWISTYDGAAY